jgi:hypothetical protein
MVPRDNDWGLALPPLLATQLVEPEVGIVQQVSGHKPWEEMDLGILKGEMEKPTSEQVGCRCLKYLDHWKETCSGDTFIALGMQTYWRDPVESLARLREEQKMRGMQEREMEPEKMKACQELLKEELDQGIVTKVRYQEVGYISPMLAVPWTRNCSSG